MKLAYLLYKDAPQMKDREQPDEMVAEVKQVDKSMPKPWVNCTPTQFAEYQMSIAPIMQEWSLTQPYMVEVERGKREAWTLQPQADGTTQLRPQSALAEEQ